MGTTDFPNASCMDVYLSLTETIQLLLMLLSLCESGACVCTICRSHEHCCTDQWQVVLSVQNPFNCEKILLHLVQVAQISLFLGVRELPSDESNDTDCGNQCSNFKILPFGNEKEIICERALGSD